MDEKVATPDLQVARIAANQHGVISFPQLARCGLTKDSIHGRLQSGRLHRTYRGVYAVGHMPVSAKGFGRAATLALPGARVRCSVGICPMSLSDPTSRGGGAA